MIAILPLWQYGMRSHEQQPTWSRPAGGEQVTWILATGHSSGSIKVWDGRGGPVIPVATIQATGHGPCRQAVLITHGCGRG